MGSLRNRLGWTMAVACFLVAFGVAVLVGYERWQDANASLATAAELEVLRLSESRTADGLKLSTDVPDTTAAVLLDAEAAVVAQAGPVSPTVQTIADELWTEGLGEEIVASDYFEQEEGPDLFATATGCTVGGICDTAVVVAVEHRLSDYLLDRWFWLLAPPLAAALLALSASRWMVGRSLAPVERMRAELAEITGTELQRRVPVPETGDELADLGLTLNRTLDRLEASNDATTRFAADAAHELRSPITGVRAALELRAGEDPLLLQSVDELDRASRLIDDLLLLAKRDSRPVAAEEIDLDDLVRQDLALAKNGGNHDHIHFTAQLQPVRLVSDGDALRRIVANLIENGGKYGRSRVDVGLATEGEQTVSLTVDDDGDGIPEPDRDRIFGRFARLDESRTRDTGGSGLGLALVAELVRDLGGTVSADDGPLGGARFVVRLPRDRT